MNTSGLKIFSFILIAIMVSSLVSAEIFVSINAQKQGKLKGGSTAKAHPGEIVAYGYSHEINSPRDAASGLATGKRQHKALSITKSVDVSTPQLYQALVTNENLPTVTLIFTRPSSGGTGTEENYFKVTLTNAHISNIKTEFPSVNGAPSTTPTDTVSFTYQKIQWDYLPGATTASDDWETVA